MSVTYDDFARIDIRVGTVAEARPHPQARKPALLLTIDFGPGVGRKTSSAQLTRHYTPDGLIGRQVAARQIGPVRSEVLVLGFPDADGAVVLVTPDRPVPDGGRLF